MQMPLEGIRVLDCAGGIAGPTAGMILGQLGAEVIKIEEPIGGGRSEAAVRGETVRKTMRKEQLINFVTINRNKKSITVDLQQKAGQEIVHRLVAKSDVFHTASSKRVSARLNLDYETLSRINPRLIYSRISGLGPKGPDCEKRAWDSIAQARSGFMWALGERGTPPSLMVGAISDVREGTICAFGIVTALLARERLGIGQEIDSSMLHSAMWLQMVGIAGMLWRGQLIPRFTREHANVPLTNYYKCSDGKWIMVWESNSDVYWHEFCQVVGIEHLEKDPRFQNHEARKGHREELIKVLDALFATKSCPEWLRIFDERRVSFAHSPVHTALDLPTDTQVVENEYLTDFNDPILGLLKLVSFPVKFGKTPANEGTMYPELGEHTRAVLLQLGGYTEEEVEELSKQRII